jgi:crotonobetainyl-CoA:carnitine CoA-transferase CaiB-like acyl-CoA transferase
MAAAILGDLGADVIKIEERGRGDPMRGFRLPFAQAGERTAHFEVANRNKRGMVLDLRQQDGREILYKLAAKSDVLIHNLRPGAVQKLGLGYDTLSRLNRRLVYGQASGWGLKGPESDEGAFDIAAAARSGFMYMLGEVEEEAPPQTPPGGISDIAGAMTLAIGILAALQARERTGRGQVVDTSIFGAIISLLAFNIGFAVSYGFSPPRRPRSRAPNPLCNLYKCADQEWIEIYMLQFDKYWSSFCEAMGIKELEHDPRFETLDAIVNHSRELIPVLDQVFACKTRGEWMKVFSEWDFVFAPIQRATDLVNDPQALANDYVVEFEHPAHGPQKVVGLPYQFSETPGSVRRPCPEYGQHTEEILLELGYTWDDIVDLKQGEVI